MKKSFKSAVLAVAAASALASGMAMAADQTSGLRAGSATVESGYVQRVTGGVQHTSPSASFMQAHENDVRLNASVTDHNQNG